MVFAAVKPDGSIAYGSSSKSKSPHGNKHSKDDYKNKAAKLQDELNEQKELNRRLSQLNQEVKEKQQRAVEALQGYQRLAVGWKGDAERLKAANQNLLRRLEDRDNEVQKRDRYIGVQEKDIEKKDKQITAQDKEIQKKDKHIAIQNNEIEDLVEDKRTWKATNKELRDEKEGLRQEAIKLKSENMALKDSQIKLGADNRKLTQEMQNLFDKLDEARSQIIKMNAQLLEAREDTSSQRQAPRQAPRPRQEEYQYPDRSRQRYDGY